jgi:hypothetical protein
MPICSIKKSDKRGTTFDEEGDQVIVESSCNMPWAEYLVVSEAIIAKICYKDIAFLLHNRLPKTS